MTREEFLSQAESMKKGLTEEQMVQAILADVRTCQYLAAQGQMYCIEEYTQGCFIDNIINAINGIKNNPRGSSNPKLMKDKIKASLTFMSAGIYGILCEIEIFELVYLIVHNPVIKEAMQASNMSVNDIIWFGMNELFPLICTGICDEKIKFKPNRLTKSDTVTIDDAYNKEDIETMITGIIDEMASEYGKLANGEVQMTKEHAEELKKMLGEFNIDKLKQMKAMSKEERDKAIIDVLYSIVEPGLNELSDAEKETAKETSMEVMAESGMLGKIFDLFIQVLEAYPDEQERQVISMGEATEAASVNHVMSSDDRVSPKDIADRLNRDKKKDMRGKGKPKTAPAQKPEQPKQKPSTPPVAQPAPQEPKPEPVVDPTVQQKVTFTKLEAQVNALKKMITFIPNHQLMPQEVDDLYIVMTNPNVQSTLHSHEIISNMNVPYIWELADHKLFDKSKYNLVFAAESFKKDTRIVILVNTLGKNVKIRECQVMEVMRPNYVK